MNPLCRNIAAALVVLMMTVLPAMAQITVSGTVNSASVGVGERVTFTVEVQNADVGDITLGPDPWTTGLVAVSARPSVSRSIDIVDRRLTTTVRYRWTYEALAEGIAAIGSVDVQAGGESFTTAPIEVAVVPVSQRLGDSSRRDDIAVQSQDVFIEGVPSTDTAVVNEQVIVEYRLFYREGVQLRQSRMAGSWDTPGFWREEMEVDLRPHPERRIVNGLPYSSIVLKRVATYPTRDGRLLIEPFRIESEVRSRAGDPRDPFASYRNRFRTMEITSNAIEILVRPLPEGAPPAFNGAIGQFGLVAQRPSPSLETGDPFQLTLRLTGSGNLAMIDAPEIRLPESFDQFAPSETTRIERSGPRPHGRKTFAYTAVPTEPGTFEIPQIEFSYFNPESWTYETIRLDSSVVTVEGSALLREGDSVASRIIRDAGWQSSPGRPLHLQPWAYAPIAIPVLAWVLLPAAVRLRNGRRNTRSAMAKRRAIEVLRERIDGLRRQPPDRALASLFQISIEETALPADLRNRVGRRVESARYAPPAVRKQLADDLICDITRMLNRLPSE